MYALTLKASHCKAFKEGGGCVSWFSSENTEMYLGPHREMGCARRCGVKDLSTVLRMRLRWFEHLKRREDDPLRRAVGVEVPVI